MNSFNKLIFCVLAIFGSLTAKEVKYTKLIDSDINSSTIEFNLDNFDLVPVITEKGPMNIVKFNQGASLLKKGAPDVQKFSKSIIIPDNGETIIDIINSEYTDYHNIYVAPSKGNLSRLVNPDDLKYEFGFEYNENDFYPNTIAELQKPYILKNLRGQVVEFHPIQYNPIEKILRVYNKIIVEINSVSNSNGENILNRKSGKQHLSQEYKNIYKDHFLNFTSDNRFDYLNDQGNMLIISYGSFMEEMYPLINWKNKKGLPTEIVNVADIGANSSDIKNYINEYYYENGLTFLLLVGDIDQIPSPTISGSASDPSYGFIEGNDSYAEVIVGRFSGSTPSHIATQVQRSIDYERYPQSNADWYDNAMGIASTQGPGFGGYTDDEFNDFVWETVLSEFTYDSYHSSYDGSGSVSQGMDAINSGIGMINYTGHGSISGWGNGAPISTSNVNTLTNNHMLPFVISVACNVGEFNSTNECFAESWLRATNNGEPTGGIGHLGSTISQSWEPPMHGQYGMNLILTESYEGHITRSMGGIATNGCLYMNDAQGASGINETNYWTLFGDPSLHLRTDQPNYMNVNHDATIVLGQSEYIIDTGVDNAIVALSLENNLLSFANSENGIAILNLEDIDLQPGDYDLIITSFNSYPYEATISVITPEGPYITLDSYNLSDSNNNGMAEFDETISISFNANNVGVDPTSNVTGSISTEDPYITLSNTDFYYNYINAGQTVESSEIVLEIAHNVPDGHNANFSIVFNSPDGQWNSNFNLPIFAPNLTVSNPSFLDSNGNTDGIWDAGETITISLLLNNEGSVANYTYPGIHLSENSENASIDSEEFFWFYGIEAGTSMQADFQVSASEEANMGTEVEFTTYATELNCEQNCIESTPITFSFTIGLPIDENLHEPLNLIAEADENGNSISLSWDEPFACPEGQFADCIGQCVDEWYESWIGDGLCDDGTWDVYLNCDEFNNDGGDCGDIITCEDQGLVTCPNGTCEEYEENCPETSCDEGYVDDCSGDGDCCPDGWIGDGIGDCEDQAYGCDLTCYENDGGDCGTNEGDCDPNLPCLQVETCIDGVLYPTGCGPDNCDDPIGDCDRILHDRIDKIYPSRLNVDFSDVLIVPKNIRELSGYFVFRNGAYIAFTQDQLYNDFDIISNEEYCYHITAVYDEGQSEPSNTYCIILDSNSNVIGDVNGDGDVNVQDIITIINMILGNIDSNEDLADLNNDGYITIQDIIIVINILLGDRSHQSENNTGTKANIYKHSSSVSISSNGRVSAVQMELTHNGNFNLTLSNAMISEYNTIGNKTIIVIIDPENDELYKYNGVHQIESLLVTNINGDLMETHLTNNIHPHVFELNQNFPNPFNPTTSISFSINTNSKITLCIYDIKGREIKSIVNNSFYTSGKYQVLWDGKNNMGVPAHSGMYIYKLISGNKELTKKMLLMK